MRIGQWATVACGLVLIAVSVVAAAGNLLAVDLGSGYLKVGFGFFLGALARDSFHFR